jgi:hypothetical protein
MRPFEGIRVLDFTHVYAGPFATVQLAVMKAEVIKIEAPGKPDQIRLEGVDEALNEQGLGTSYVFNNQGKKAISLKRRSLFCVSKHNLAALRQHQDRPRAVGTLAAIVSRSGWRAVRY